jgi:hypothetical protein
VTAAPHDCVGAAHGRRRACRCGADAPASIFTSTPVELHGRAGRAGCSRGGVYDDFSMRWMGLRMEILLVSTM